MPNALVYVVRARAVAELLGLTTDDLVPLACLKVPDGAGKESGANEV